MRKISFLLVLVLLLSGCATIHSTKKLRRASLGMSKEEIVKVIGEPTVVRGAIINKFNQTVEVWEYKMDKGKTAGEIGVQAAFAIVSFGLLSPALFVPGEIQHYWLYFYDNKLVQWGQAGDWGKEADRIYEFNFNPEKSLTK